MVLRTEEWNPGRIATCRRTTLDALMWSPLPMMVIPGGNVITEARTEIRGGDGIDPYTVEITDPAIKTATPEASAATRTREVTKLYGLHYDFCDSFRRSGLASLIHQLRDIPDPESVVMVKGEDGQEEEKKKSTCMKARSMLT